MVIRSIRALVGLPVLMDGKALGHLMDVELDEGMTRMNALFADGGLTGMRKIAREDVLILGDVAVLVSSKGERGRPRPARMRRALMSDGSRVGAVTGALLNERTKTVEAVELTRGYLDDLISGRRWIFRYAVNMTSGDVLIMPEGGDAE